MLLRGISDNVVDPHQALHTFVVHHPPPFAELYGHSRRPVGAVGFLPDGFDLFDQPPLIELGKRGWVVNHKRVERLMRIHNIVGYTPKKHRVTTIGDGEHRIPDLVQRDFTRDAPDVTWCGDISYINTWEGFLYLSFVEDLASRRILGLSMASHMRAVLVGDALDEAVGTRGR